MTRLGAREAGVTNRLGGNRCRGPVMTTGGCHALGCRVLGSRVYLGYSSPSPPKEKWVWWGRCLAGPKQNAGDTMSIGIRSRTVAGVLVGVALTWG